MASDYLYIGYYVSGLKCILARWFVYFSPQKYVTMLAKVIIISVLFMSEK